MLLLKLSSLIVLKFFILIEVFANSTIFQHFNTSINFSIWSHFNRYLHAISTTYHPPSSNPRSKPNRHMNPVINNWFAHFQPSSVCVCQYESNLYHKQDLLTTTSKIYWPPQARFLIACHPNFKCGSRESYSPNHDEVQNTMWLATLQHMKGWLVRCSTCALGFSQSHLHVCQNLIFMSSLI